MFEGFEPFYQPDSKILILGSFPSVKSREVNFYYGNALNKFWKILNEIYNLPIDSIADKKLLLTKANIALWDIVSKCEITGSLDSNIKNYSIADLSIILNNSNIEKILLNGKTAYKLFSKAYPNLIEISHCLPSTSPANTRFDKQLWIDALNLNL